MKINPTLSPRQLLIIELSFTLLFCVAPLFYANPYRLNIFLSWEGAYRLYLGQVPFRDFSLPMGYGYWIIPAFFFMIFGPFMHTLIIAQVFLNAVSVLAFRSILRLFDLEPVTILLSVVVFCFSYVTKNFWPWYNHSVIVFELVSIYFLLCAVVKPAKRRITANIIASAFFTFLAIFTKQDAGILTLVLAGGILIYDALIEKTMRKLLLFFLAILAVGMLFILPALPYDFNYWFNYGQAPHNSRIVLNDFFRHILGWAYWEKFFLFVVILAVAGKMRSGATFFLNKQVFLFAFVSLFIMIEALIVQVTSDEPPYGEDFFYAFGFAFCYSHLSLQVNLARLQNLAVALALIAFWWSGIFWRNIQRVASDRPVAVGSMERKARQKFRLASEFKTLDRLYLADSTLGGISRLKGLRQFRNAEAKVLNMSELTSLAYEIPFTPLTGQPMWFHQGVSIFQPEVDSFCRRIDNEEFDVVLFQSIPINEVVNFFPEDVKRRLDERYNLEFIFLAPRTPAESYIHVYTRR
jgi:hypothetical protein